MGLLLASPRLVERAGLVETRVYQIGVEMRFVDSSSVGSACWSSRKYFNTIIPRWVTAKTTLALPTMRSSTRLCFFRKSKYSFSTLQFRFALYIMCVNFSGPLWARTLRM